MLFDNVIIKIPLKFSSSKKLPPGGFDVATAKFSKMLYLLAIWAYGLWDL